MNQQLMFFVYIASISLASGPILSITAWYAKVSHAASDYLKYDAFQQKTQNDLKIIISRHWEKGDQTNKKLKDVMVFGERDQ